MKPDVLTALRTASQGLLYPSETDAPFEPFSWGKADGDLTPQKVARLAKAAAGTTVEEQSAADFFQFLIDNGGDHADAFRKLQQVVSQQLSGVRVFRVGGSEHRRVRRRADGGGRMGGVEDAFGGDVIRVRRNENTPGRI